MSSCLSHSPIFPCSRQDLSVSWTGLVATLLLKVMAPVQWPRGNKFSQLWLK